MEWVSWIPSRSSIQQFVRSSLAYCDLVEQPYVRRPGGSLRYDGERPGPTWHAHGWFFRTIRLVQGGRFVRKVVWKRRWKDPATGRTRHSRPPDEVGPVRWCVLGVLLTLWAVLAQDGDRIESVARALAVRGQPWLAVSDLHGRPDRLEALVAWTDARFADGNPP